jgi:hypothetical protein
MQGRHCWIRKAFSQRDSVQRVVGKMLLNLLLVVQKVQQTVHLVLLRFRLSADSVVCCAR